VSFFQPEPCASFKPMMPAMIKPTETRRQALVCVRRLAVG